MKNGTSIDQVTYSFQKHNLFVHNYKVPDRVTGSFCEFLPLFSALFATNNKTTLNFCAVFMSTIMMVPILMALDRRKTF